MTLSTPAGYAAGVTKEQRLESAVRVTPEGLVLGGELLPLIAGEIHYFQHDRQSWPALLDAAVELGVGLLSTYVPWGRHELAPGRWDFGRRRPRLDLPHLLALAADRGLRVILRPGPHVNAELTWLGYPRRLLELEGVAALTAGGHPLWLPIAPRPMPIPSYASSRFLAETDRWLEAVAEQARDHQWPAGPLVAIQLDNEAPLLFRNGPFDQDYHPEAIESFQALSAARGRPVEEPPRRLDAGDRASLLATLDWLDARVEVFARALRRMRATLEQAGLDAVAYTHNLAQAGVMPELCPDTFDAADLVGFDFYHRRDQLPLLRDRCRYVVGSTALPFAAELGVGGPWNLPPRGPEDSLEQLRAVLASGFRAFNLFMAADRDRYYGAPIDAGGRRRRDEVGRGVSALIEAICQPDLELHRLRLRAPVAVVVPRLYPRMTQASWALGPMLPPALAALGLELADAVTADDFGFAEPVQRRWLEVLARLGEALVEGDLGWVLVDGDAAAERLEALGPQVVIALTFEAIDDGLWGALLARVEAGSELIFGPRAPELNEDFEPLGGAEPRGLELGAGVDWGAGRLRLEALDDEAVCRELVAELASRPEMTPAYGCAEPGVEVTVLERAGEARALGVLELEGERRRVALRTPAGVSARDLQRGGEVELGALELEPYGVRLLEVEEGR